MELMRKKVQKVTSGRQLQSDTSSPILFKLRFVFTIWSLIADNVAFSDYVS